MSHYAKKLKHAPRLLDIGCGHGNLAELLSKFLYQSYLGLDLSPEVVRRASRRNIKNAEFEVADAEENLPPEKFDFILLTGAINYFKNPLDFLERCFDCLDENGLIVISLWRYGHNGVIWKNIENHFEIVNSAVVTNDKGMSWDIKVIRQKLAG